MRADTAGATQANAYHCQRCDLRFSFGYELTETIRNAILETPEDARIPALDQDGSVRQNGQVVRSRTASISAPGRRAGREPHRTRHLRLSALSVGDS